MCKTCAERAGLAKQRSFVRASLSNFDLNGHPLSQSLRYILHVAAEGSGIPIFLKGGKYQYAVSENSFSYSFRHM